MEVSISFLQRDPEAVYEGYYVGWGRKGEYLDFLEVIR